jgi:hypothetical protein
MLQLFCKSQYVGSVLLFMHVLIVCVYAGMYASCVCMLVCMHREYVCWYVCIVCMYAGMYASCVCMLVCMHRVYVCWYVCMYGEQSYLLPMHLYVCGYV